MDAQYMNTLNITNSLLKEYGLFAKKGYGQNFLIDDNILEQIVDAGDITAQDIVIEIGPGLGNLTSYLVKKAKKVIAFEIDKDMIEILNNRFAGLSNLMVVNEDIMKVNLNEYTKDSKIKIIANLPYYITSPILFKLLEHKEGITDIVIMVQKEVAQRLIAKPKSKDYGVLTVNTNYISNIQKITDVPNSSFIPAPNVTSAVVKLQIDVSKAVDLVDENLFKKLVKVSFSQRRKKVINSIVNSQEFNITKEQLEDIVKKIGYNESIRAEEISVDKYIEFANILKDSGK